MPPEVAVNLSVTSTKGCILVKKRCSIFSLPIIDFIVDTEICQSKGYNL